MGQENLFGGDHSNVANPVLKAESNTLHRRKEGRPVEGPGALCIAARDFFFAWPCNPPLPQSAPRPTAEMFVPRRPPLLSLLLCLSVAFVGARAKECYQLVKPTSSGFQEVDNDGIGGSGLNLGGPTTVPRVLSIHFLRCHSLFTPLIYCHDL